MSVTKDDKKRFKYWRKCKLPSCRKKFGTNRKWQEFCPKDEETGRNCQQEWHRLLRKKHEEVIVEMAILKEDVIKIKNKLGIK